MKRITSFLSGRPDRSKRMPMRMMEGTSEGVQCDGYPYPVSEVIS